MHAGEEAEIEGEGLLEVARTEGRIKCSIWTDKHFLSLPDRSRLLYLFLLTQEDMAISGLISLRVARWSSRMGWSSEALEEAAAVLESERFVVQDGEQGELWIRTLIRHEGILAQPNWLQAARRSFAAVASEKIKRAFVAEYPDLAAGWGLDAIPDAIPDAIRMPSPMGPGIGNREKGIGNREQVTVLVGTREVGLVFAAWVEAGGLADRTKLTEDRRRKVKARLREYPFQDVVDAAVGIWEHEWHREHGQTDLALALRDGAHLEKFRDVHRGLVPRSDPKRLGSIDRDLKRAMQEGRVDMGLMAKIYPEGGSA